MLRNYFKVMVRNLLKRKAYTLINLLGLATGMAACLLMVLYLQNEFGYDEFQEKGNQVYRVALERKYPGRSAFFAEIPSSIGAAIQKEFPEVIQSTRMLDYGPYATLKIGDEEFNEKRLIAVDSNFFHVFSASFLLGDKNTALQNQNTAVINESTAIKCFGSVGNAMGKTFRPDSSQFYRITGICRDWPEKTHMQFDVLLSTTGLPEMKTPNYYLLSDYTYVLLNKNADPLALEAKLPMIVEKYVAPSIQKGFGETFQQFKSEGNGYRYFLQPVKKIHLYSDLIGEWRPNGSIAAVYLFLTVALFILFLACINFINLSTAISLERAKEVGIRKTFGSAKNTLIGQFLTESMVFSLVSMLIGMGLAKLAIPLINEVTGTGLSFAWFANPLRLLFLLVFALLIGIVAGVYPAFALSSFEPILVLKGRFKSGSRGIALRNSLVVFQFSISVILIIGTIVVNSQMRYVLGDKLGFNKDHVIVLETEPIQQTPRQSFMDELTKTGGVQSISQCSSLPDGLQISSTQLQVEGTKLFRTEQTLFADDKYADLLGLEVLQGRFFSKDFPTDSFAVVLNEEAVKDLQLKNPLGARIVSTKPLLNPRDEPTQTIYRVIGVVKDYHFQNLHNKIAPLVMLSAQKFGGSRIAVKIKGDQFKASLFAIGKLWDHYDPKHPVQYSFLDQDLAAQYRVEQTTQKICSIFSLLAIFIACIGLFGLATYSTLQRIREIGIRKVLGATPARIIFILSNDFLRLVVISLMIAFPVAGWAMHKWLQNFAYRVDIDWWIFALAGGAAIFIAFATISFQAIKAALTNPIKSLRTE
jgi:putative ABC transport system permease protein